MTIKTFKNLPASPHGPTMVHICSCGNQWATYLGHTPSGWVPVGATLFCCQSKKCKANAEKAMLALQSVTKPETIVPTLKLAS